jgi:dTDP-4-amino-4,6-dideoxygalactose transaminase
MSTTKPSIQMVDLKTQYQKLQNEIDTAVLDVIRSGAFINGPAVKSFKANFERYLDAKHVIPCANGTDALQIALMATGMQPGDEVIVPAFTYVSTAEVIALLGFKPIMVDVDPDTFNVTPEIVEAAITPNTKGVVPVNLFGQSCDLEPIMQIAEKHSLWVIEDNAQAIGADYTFSDGHQQKTGTVGHIGCTSFYPSKNLGAYGDGGALYTNDDELADRLHKIANHGQTKRYYHGMIGVNSRLDSIQAAILDIKLKHLDDYAAGRRRAADFYDKAFAEVAALKTPVRDPKSTHVFHQYTLKVLDGKRDELQAYLQDQGIPCMIYYPVPLYEQEAFKGSAANAVDHLPVTDMLCKQVISLPMHPELDNEMLTHITDGVKSFFNQ